MQKSLSAHRLTPKLFNKKSIESYSHDKGRNFINRIETRAMSATRNLKSTFRGKSLTLDVKASYKMLILNWGKELEKHDKILEKFHIFAPLKYDIDATFHKLFSARSKDLIKQKLKHKKKNNLMKAGYLEQEIDLMFESENAIPNKNYGFENDEILLSTKYEKDEIKEEFDNMNCIDKNIINIQSEKQSAQNLINNDEQEAEKELPVEIIEEQENNTENDRNINYKSKPVSITNDRIDEQQEDETRTIVDENKTPIKVKAEDQDRDEIADDNNSAYSSPFKNDSAKERQEDAFTLLNSHPAEREFPDQDIQMKIRDKDIVFIYEIDDMIKQITSSDKLKPLDEHPEILDVLNKFSKLFRHYIRYRVVDIGDLVGGLFLDGFWKTLLITIDNILQSVDNRFKKRVIKLQQQYSKVIEQMNQKLADKDREMRAMDQTDYIETLKGKLELIKTEKIMYQKLAQDKLDFIEMLTSNDKKYPGFTGAKDLYDTARELIESIHIEKKNRVTSVSKLDDIFQTGKILRKTQTVETQTETSYIAPIKIKDIVLPTLDDHQIIQKYNHPFSDVLKFLNQESVKFEKKLTFEPYSLSEMFNISETILDRIGNDLLEKSQEYENNQKLLQKRNKSPRGRPRSPKRKKKKGKDAEGFPISYIRIDPNYPCIEQIYVQQI